MIVYHGTDIESAINIVNNGINLKYGDESVDNGQGFYTTPNYDFAFQRARSTANTATKFNNSESKPAVIKLDIDVTSAKLDDDIKIKNFDGCTPQWQEFVFYNRLGKRFLKKWNIFTSNHNLDHKYDIVIDETADSHIADLVSSMRYSKSIKNLDNFIDRVYKSNRKNWDKQISLHTKNALKYVKNMEIMNI